jgi:hypothetical protein
MMKRELTANYSPWRMAFILLGAAVFVVLGFWMIGLFGEVPHNRRWPAEIVQIVGWLSIVFFGACAIIGVPRLFNADLQLRVSEHGIYWKPWSDDTIPWHEIRDVRVWEYRRQKAIVLCLEHPERYPSKSLLGKLAALNRGLMGGDVSISLTGMNRSFGEAFATIQEFHGTR